MRARLEWTYPAAAFLLFLLLPPSAVFGSPAHATISGLVADSAGAPLPGAGITLEGEGLGPIRVITDALGRYRFPAVDALRLCSIRAELAGFRSVTYEGIFTDPGRTRIVPFRLKRPDERDIAALVTRDPFPYEEFLRGFTARVGVPVRVIDLDREPDPAETVRRVRAERPDLIVGAGLRAARFIRRENFDVPSILTLVTDPRHYDLQAGPIGLVIQQPDADHVLDRIASVLTGVRRLGFVYDADTAAGLARDMREASERRGIKAEMQLCRSHKELVTALDELRGKIDVLVVPNDDLTSTRRAQEIITAWSLRNHVPLAAPSPEWVEHGALFSYSASYGRLGEETSVVAARILRGDLRPSDFGVMRSDEFELSVNRSTAKLLGVEIPGGLRAEQVD